MSELIIEYDLSPAMVESVFRDKLVELGWGTPDRIKELETQLVEANQRADKAAKDGWLKTAETQLARAKKAEAQLDKVRDAFAGMKFVSADKDNMEFNVKLTCWQKEALRAILEKDDVND